MAHACRHHATRLPGALRLHKRCNTTDIQYICHYLSPQQLCILSLGFLCQGGHKRLMVFYIGIFFSAVAGVFAGMLVGVLVGIGVLVGFIQTPPEQPLEHVVQEPTCSNWSVWSQSGSS